MLRPEYATRSVTSEHRAFGDVLRGSIARKGLLSGERPRGTRVIEILGLPGSGKTTLSALLLDKWRGRATLVRPRDMIPRIAVARCAIRVALPFMAQLPFLRERRAYRYRSMVLLQCAAQALLQAQRAYDIALFDAGPVYLMSQVERARQTLASRTAPMFERYWAQVLDTWASTLDLIVVLDGPDSLLHTRIRQRGTPHVLLNASLSEASTLFAARRRSRDALLHVLAQRSPTMRLLALRADLPAPDALSQLEQYLTAPVGDDHC